MLDLTGKVAIVTGGSSGIGETIVRTFVAAGARVAISDINEEAGKALADELGEQAAFMRHDVTSEDDWNRVIDDVVARWGALNILVNNAGVLIEGTVETLTYDQWKSQFAVHSDAPFLGSKLALPHMVKAGYGRLINISSSGAALGYPKLVAYGSAKSAQLGLTRSIAAHCRQNGYPVTANAIQPSGITTPMVQHMFDQVPESQRAGIDAYLKRVGKTDDIANFALYLASPEGGYVSGQSVLIDGAMTYSVNDLYDDRLGPGYNFVQ